MAKEYICEIDYDKDPCVVYREPIVRCKDCKYHTAYNECTCPQWDINDYDYPITYDDGFCKWGERMESSDD